MNSHKKMIMEMLPAPPPEYFNEKLSVTKWECMNFPSKLPLEHQISFEMFEDAFSYNPGSPENTEWHVNFADAKLFGFFEGSLFAQDEMQVMEHPCLGSVRLAMENIAQKKPEASPFTRSKSGGHSTPILIKGAKRRVAVATNVDAAAGRPDGLYGRAFANASTDAVRAAVRIINPPTTTNVIAIEAPKSGHGSYTKAQIKDAFETAYTGFLAARLESKHDRSDLKYGLRVVIHTGNWGTGAFGGNKILMPCIQLVAAHVAEVDKLVFHTFAPPSTEAYKQAKALYDEIMGTHTSVFAILDTLFNKEFKWGASDGN